MRLKKNPVSGAERSGGGEAIGVLITLGLVGLVVYFATRSSSTPAASPASP
jgi:hypothetical protein